MPDIAHTSDSKDLDFKQQDAGSYDAVAGYFDKYTERFSRYMLQPMFELAQVPPDGYVLDVGTGTGVVALDVARRIKGKGHVVGIDLSEGMLATASTKAGELDKNHDVEFRRADAENLGFDNASFDTVFSLYALRHFPNPDKALAEMFRVLKPGGRVVVAVGSRPPLLSAGGAKAVARKPGSLWRQATGRELSACEFIDQLVERQIPASDRSEVPGWVSHRKRFVAPINKLVATAGFRNLQASWRGQYSIIQSPEDFWLLQMTFSSLARKRIASADSATVAKLKQEFIQQCARVLKRGGRLVYQTGSAIVAAEKI